MHVFNHPSFLSLDFQNNMAEGGPDSASQSSQNKPSCQEEEVAIVEPDVTCGHCEKELNNPHLLCCLHSVCAEYLPNMVVENGRLKCSKCGDTSTVWNDGKMSESECRVDSLRCFPVPNGPLARFMERRKLAHKVSKNTPIPCENRKCRRPVAHSTVFCFDCENFLCERCHDAHEMMSAYDDHTVKALEEIRTSGPSWDATWISKKISHIQCPQHRGKVLEYSCEQCDLLMCQACAVDRRSSHTPVFLSDKVADRHTQSIKIARQAAFCFGKKCKKIEQKLQSQIRTVDEMKEAALVNIDTAFQTIHEAVEKRKEELCRQVITTAEEKKRTIGSKLTAAQREKETSANAESSLHFLLSSGNSHDVLACKDLVQTHQSVVTSKWCQEELESTVSQVVTFDPTNQDALLKAIGKFGVAKSGACPANCTVEPKPESVQWNGSDPVTLTVTTFDRENIQCKRGGENVEAFLHPKSPIPGPAIKARVVNDNSGRYTISFPTTYPGECDLYIRVNRSDIRGSPFVVNFLPSGLPKLNKNVRELGANKGYINYSQQGGGPWGIAVGQNGHIFIADYYQHQINVFDKQRKYIRSFGQKGSGNGQLNCPTGIAVDCDNRLYIGNQDNNRIEVVESEGTFVRQIGAGHLSRLWGVTIHNKHVYVADSGNHRISVFTLDGQLIRTIGSQGSGPGQFSTPSAVAFAPDENGDMYVIDYSNRVQVFSAHGVYQRQFGEGHLKNPLDIIITADRHVIVADNNNGVVIFNTMGQLIHSFQVGSRSFGLAIDHNGDLLVTLYNTKQVVVF